jgi:hypothetical protein
MKSRRQYEEEVGCDASPPLLRPEHAPDGTAVLQHGVARTNCVDCLDRTNVLQFGIGLYFLASWILFLSLKKYLNTKK